MSQGDDITRSCSRRNSILKHEIEGLKMLEQSDPIRSEMLYDLDDRPTPQCHASTIAETPAGLVAAWFGGTQEGNPDVGIWVSRHNGIEWSAPVEVADGVLSPSKRYPCWNPVLFYKVGPSPSSWWGMLMTSDDHGMTWGAPWKPGENPLVDHLLGPVKNTPILLEDGSILCPSSSEHSGWQVHFEVTGNLDRTWDVIGPINDGEEFGAIQPSILIYPDGGMQILCRSLQKVIAQS